MKYEVRVTNYEVVKFFRVLSGFFRAILKYELRVANYEVGKQGWRSASGILSPQGGTFRSPERTCLGVARRAKTDLSRRSPQGEDGSSGFLSGSFGPF